MLLFLQLSTFESIHCGYMVDILRWGPTLKCTKTHHAKKKSSLESSLLERIKSFWGDLCNGLKDTTIMVYNMGTNTEREREREREREKKSFYLFLFLSIMWI